MTIKYLIVGPAWVGDMIMAQTLLKQLTLQSADPIIDVVAPASTGPLVARMPEVRRLWEVPFQHGRLQLLQRYRMGKSLKAEGYQQAIVLPNSFKSALLPFWAGIPERIGWKGECRMGVLNDVRYLKKHDLPLMIQRFVHLGLPADAAIPDALPKPHLQVSEQCIQAALNRVGLRPPERPVLALCPGAEYGPAKQWPTEYYAEVARVCAERGWDIWLFGSPKDKPVATQIDALSGSVCVNLAGKTRLLDAVDLLALVSAVVTNDSGLMHVAAALDKPLVALYGSSSPRFTPPLSDRATILSLNMDCSPCFKRVCPLGHFQCMKSLKPDRVLSVLPALDTVV